MIRLDTHSKVSLYEQLYQQIRDDIVTGRLKKDAPLKSLRVLEKELGVSRTTVGSAYQQLVAEGYIRSMHGAGYFVEDIGTTVTATAKRSLSSPLTAQDMINSHIDEKRRVKYDFDYKGIEPQLFPWNKWHRAVNNAIDYDSFQVADHSACPKGSRRLRESLTDFLYHHRGVACSPEQIVVCSGTQYAMGIILSLLSPTTHRIAFEEPGSGSMRSYIENRGYDVVSVPTPRDGLMIEALKLSHCNVVHTTPSYQFPTGAMMSLENRGLLLEWAAENDAYIIENDHNCYFHDEGMPAPSLQSLDTSQRVIYIGSLSTILPSSIGFAYLVLPLELLEMFEEKFPAMSPMFPSYHELAFAQFFEDGTLDRHIRKMSVINNKKLVLLSSCIVSFMSHYVDLMDVSPAAHSLVKVKDCHDQNKLLMQLEKASIRIYGMRTHCHEKTENSESIFIMGINSLNEEDLIDGCEQMSSVLTKDLS